MSIRFNFISDVSLMKTQQFRYVENSWASRCAACLTLDDMKFNFLLSVIVSQFYTQLTNKWNFGDVKKTAQRRNHYGGWSKAKFLAASWQINFRDSEVTNSICETNWERKIYKNFKFLFNEVMKIFVVFKSHALVIVLINLSLLPPPQAWKQIFMIISF